MKEIVFKGTAPKKEKMTEISLDSQVGECAEHLMNAAKSLHKLHLKIKGQGSFAAHSALQAYDEFHDFSDSLVESYQGAVCRIIVIPDMVSKPLNTVQEAITFLEDIKMSITTLQSKLPFSEIVNDLDMVKSKINSIKYKLEFLS